MLEIKRRENEKITIVHNGEVLEITVRRHTEGQLSFRFEGPRSFNISRPDAKALRVAGPRPMGARP